MIGSRSSWAVRLTSLAHRSAAHHQKRSKAFVRRIDKNNEVYYTISNKRPPKSPDSIPVRDDFFEMPDLLLDLDADGSRFVRPVEEVDEERLERKWDVNPKRLAVQDHLKQLQKQISESRRKADDVLSNPTNIWRLSSHDIVSAALRGTPATVDGNLTTKTTLEVSSGPSKHASRRCSRPIETLCRENGIPPHALQDEQVLLEWMLLRYGNLKRSITNRSEEPLSPSQLTAALKKQTSITGIRRLVFHSLRSGETVKSYFPEQKGVNKDSKGTPDISYEIRNACLNILNQHPEEAAAYPEILSFIGNLAARLSLHGESVGSALTGLALRFSAAAGNTGAASEWLHRGFVNNTWQRHAASSSDVAEALKTFIQHLRDAGKGGFYSAHDRQLLLQLLTGINEHHSLSGDSFRSLPLFYLGEQSKVSTDAAYEMYESYIILLGLLGAVRTLWKEWHVSRPIVMRFLKPSGNVQRLEDLYKTSLLGALHIAAQVDSRGLPDVELNECVALDYHSIAEQDTNSWLINGRETTAPNKPTGRASSLPSFNLPLDEWIAKIDEAVRQDATSVR
ncbi:hypothetical protein TARUN_3180 [Trichoderma arundinaceum]|uniref:Uncharacterized protein n=1 Tax=Trichoderma arundinaceum TaxID=490622 RepID=A0A395NSY5_TRIAR|nr:hypothetical protein TARUN_3180 [Trichoderma arundinaceum]